MFTMRELWRDTVRTNIVKWLTSFFIHHGHPAFLTCLVLNKTMSTPDE